MICAWILVRFIEPKEQQQAVSAHARFGQTGSRPPDAALAFL
jgi:hypothetical protein